MRLRDEASSKILRGISREECVTLLEQSMEARSGLAKARARDHDTSKYDAPGLSKAIRELLPTAPERLVTGVVKLVERATREFVAFQTHRDELNSLSAEQGSSTGLASASVTDIAASEWNFPTYHIRHDETQESLTAHLTAVGKFLRGESAAGALPLARFNWFPMLDQLAFRCWRTYWQVTANQMQQKSTSEPCWLEFLKFWHELGIANLPGRFDLLIGDPKKSVEEEIDFILNAKSYTIRRGDDHFIVRRSTEFNSLNRYRILRYSTASEPGPPPGFGIADTLHLHANYDPDQITQFISCLESATTLPLPTKEELRQVAEALSVSTSEIALIWLGGFNMDSYQSNFLPAELRQALGLKTTEASAGRQVLRNLSKTTQKALFESVIAAGLTVPLSNDRGPALRSIEATWREVLPKRLPVSAEFQKRLAAISGATRWNHQDHEELLLLAADPVNHPLMKPKVTKLTFDRERTYQPVSLCSPTPGENILTAEVLRSIVQLSSLVHTETPIGHAARPCICLLIENLTKLLESGKTMLQLAGFYVVSPGPNPTATPTNWIHKNLGKTTTDRQSGFASYQDDLFAAGGIDAHTYAFIAFHTARLNDQNDFARLRGVQAAIPPEYHPHASVENSVCVAKSLGFQKLASACLGNGLEEGQWPQNPQWTAPDILKQIQSKYKLSDRAAILYAQLLALPDPTSANVCKWNGWKGADYQATAKELVDHKLVLEATRARAGRSLFLPGEWLDLKAPWLPIESWKLTHLYEIELNLGTSLPLGGPLILRPFEDLYATAWKRVTDGDEPRYEEVRRAVKKSKKK